MKFIKKEKDLLLKYIYILIMNILLFILCNFYFKSSQYIYLILLLLNTVVSTIIYYFNGIKEFKVTLDFTFNFILSIILMFIIKNTYEYSSVLFTLLFSNNITFIRSRFSDNHIKKSIQYLMMFIYSLITLMISTFIYILIFK